MRVFIFAVRVLAVTYGNDIGPVWSARIDLCLCDLTVTASDRVGQQGKEVSQQSVRRSGSILLRIRRGVSDLSGGGLALPCFHLLLGFGGDRRLRLSGCRLAARGAVHE